MPPKPAHRLFALAGVSFLLAASVGSVAANGPGAGYRPFDSSSHRGADRLMVRFRSDATAAERASAVDSAGVARVGPAHDGRGRRVTVYRPTGSLEDARSELDSNPAVDSVTVDHKRYIDADPTQEPLWDDLWGLHSTGNPITFPRGGDYETSNDVDIDGLQAAGVSSGSPTVVVAVIDDGVDFSQPDLAGQAWTNPGESGPDGLGGDKATNGLDDDVNGYVDDVHGWDFCHDDNTVHDAGNDFHGTHVAGTIAGALDGQGIVGVAPGVRIMALKFLDRDHNNCGYDDQAIAAIAYAKSFGVRIANNSWGGRGMPDAAPDLYDAIATSGMLFIASAGNDAIDNDTDPFPALPASFDLPNVLSVAAADSAGGLAWFSNYGRRTVDIAAPGEQILSRAPAYSDSSITIPSADWWPLDGTSMAAPHVSGSAALAAAVHPAIAADPVALKARLLATGKPLPATLGLTATGRLVDAWIPLDWTAPSTTSPTRLTPVVGTRLGSTVSTKIAWPRASDAMTGVASYRLRGQAGTAAWRTLDSAVPATSAVHPLAIGLNERFAVRAVDRAGNGPVDPPSPTVQLHLYQESTTLASYSSGWRTASSSSATGGRTRYASAPGLWVRFDFTGRSFAVVAPRGPGEGKFKAYVDGVYTGTLDLNRSTTASRILVLSGSWSSLHAHSVKLVLTGGHHVDVDAFLTVR
ncbi:MAG: S8 family peptidase [Chloroflexota bacterium]